MKIKFSPQRFNELAQDKAPILHYRKIDENTIEINGEQIFFDPQFIEYNTEDIEGLNKAYRDENTNELFLEIVYRYTEEEKPIFENPNYYPEGGYRGSKYEDFTNLSNGSDII